jgi:hypothetical protein
MNKILSFLLFWLIVTQHAFAQSPLLWERQKDFSGGFDLLRSVSAVRNGALLPETLQSLVVWTWRCSTMVPRATSAGPTKRVDGRSQYQRPDSV